MPSFLDRAKKRVGRWFGADDNDAGLPRNWKKKKRRDGGLINTMEREQMRKLAEAEGWDKKPKKKK